MSALRIGMLAVVGLLTAALILGVLINIGHAVALAWIGRGWRSLPVTLEPEPEPEPLVGGHHADRAR